VPPARQAHLPDVPSPPSLRAFGLERDEGRDPVLDRRDHLRPARARHPEAPMSAVTMPSLANKDPRLQNLAVLVIGLGKSVLAAARLALARAARVTIA